MNKFTRKKLITVAIQLAVIAILTAVDLFIKKIVVDNIQFGEKVPFIDGLFGWTYVRNTGIAWSMFNDNPQLLSVFTGAIILAVAVYVILPIKRPLAYDICIPVILAGGLANLIDIISRGYVVDYIETLFLDFPIYNFADCLITCGAAALVIYLIYEIVQESKKEKKKLTEEKESE